MTRLYNFSSLKLCHTAHLHLPCLPTFQPPAAAASPLVGQTVALSSPYGCLFISLLSPASSFIWTSSSVKPSLINPHTQQMTHFVVFCDGLSGPPLWHLEQRGLLRILHGTASPTRTEAPGGQGALSLLISLP